MLCGCTSVVLCTTQKDYKYKIILKKQTNEQTKRNIEPEGRSLLVFPKIHWWRTRVKNKMLRSTWWVCRISPRRESSHQHPKELEEEDEDVKAERAAVRNAIAAPSQEEV